MSSISPSPVTRRVDTIDFWRGLVLIAILCDHIPGNLIEKATPRNFAFSDSAEAFVFLSGVSVALAHYGRAQRADWRGLLGRCFGRAYHIYGVHIGLTCAAVAIAAIGYFVSGAPGLIEADGRSFVFHQPLQAGLGVLMLTQQLGYFNILPLYVVLLLWAPAGIGDGARQPLARARRFARDICDRANPRAGAAELAGTGELVFQSFRLAARFHPWHRRLRSLARPADSEVSDALLDRSGRLDRRRIRRDRRILEAAGHPRQLVRASGSVEGRSRLRQAGAFRRAGVLRLADPGRDGRADHDRARVAAARPIQSADFRAGIDFELRGPSRHAGGDGANS